ncbi:MgtE protein [Cohnella pontilimi]|uniref:MgtE protein n=1 Tax=Cohnella pontilimi TaxID=2564100 RepID=A0A4U0FEE0_9BACL|nr:MgtE protein [Cohnella pontilimi]TJY43187.1 MgtE protein [Cohnella pontilimi]
MAKTDEEKNSYSGFERFLFFLTPILFTAVLLGMLLLLFNTDLRNKALEIGAKIPVLNAVLPEPAMSVDPGATDEQITVNNAKQKIDELKALLADREAALKKATQQTAEQTKMIEDLNAQIGLLNQDKQQRTLTADEYQARIKSLASMYGRMTPGKAAPILESMTVEETALVLGAMTDTERGRLLEKMSPKRAADVTIMLKDSDTAENKQIAALQSRVKELEKAAGVGNNALDTSELKQTFSVMKPVNAAALLLDMAGGAQQGKALQILGSLDDNARSQILSAMSDKDNKTTAALISKLMTVKP